MTTADFLALAETRMAALPPDPRRDLIVARLRAHLAALPSCRANLAGCGTCRALALLLCQS